MRFYVIAALVAGAALALLSLAVPLIIGQPEKPIGPVVTESALQPGDAARGEALYRSKCYGCHIPESGIGPAHNTSNFFARYPTDESIAEVIRAGRNPMPAFTETMLNEQALADILAYIRSLQPVP